MVAAIKIRKVSLLFGVLTLVLFLASCKPGTPTPDASEKAAQRPQEETTAPPQETTEAPDGQRLTKEGTANEEPAGSQSPAVVEMPAKKETVEPEKEQIRERPPDGVVTLAPRLGSPKPPVAKKHVVGKGSPPKKILMAEKKAEGEAVKIEAASGEKDLSDIVRDELKKLTTGQVLFNPPAEMQVGVSERVEVRISKNIAQDISSGLKGRGVPQVEKIKIGTFMKASLTGEKFKIEKISTEEQVVGDEGFAQWDWNVTALEAGLQSLSLKITVRIKMPGGAEEYSELPVFDRKIKVKVNPFYSVKMFIVTYWQWIIVTIIIPIVSYFVKRRLGSKDSGKR